MTKKGGGINGAAFVLMPSYW